MKVTVKLFATLREGHFEEEVKQFDPDFTVGQVLEDLNIPESEVKIIFVNNRHAGMDRGLCDGDVLAIFPPIGGG